MSSNCSWRCWSVSIPFKRERLSELIVRISYRPLLQVFQFPSNGKGFPNMVSDSDNVEPVVGFNSLQTGKAFRTQRDLAVENQARFLFQFPSNGKGFPNSSRVRPSTGRLSVSIPFKRERLSERFLCLFSTNTAAGEFQFPSNGKGFPNQ